MQNTESGLRVLRAEGEWELGLEYRMQNAEYRLRVLRAECGSGSGRECGLRTAEFGLCVVTRSARGEGGSSTKFGLKALKLERNMYV